MRSRAVLIIKDLGSTWCLYLFDAAGPRYPSALPAVSALGLITMYKVERVVR
jgi:hypothetical protein